MTSRGIATVDNLGAVGAYIHSKNEYAELSSLPEGAKRLRAIAVGI